MTRRPSGHRPARPGAGPLVRRARRPARATGRGGPAGTRSRPIRPRCPRSRSGRCGGAIASPRISATSPPRPPKTECSSTLTTSGTRPAAAAIARGIDRLERGHVEDARRDAVGLEQHGGREAAGRLHPGRHDQDVRALAHEQDASRDRTRSPGRRGRGPHRAPGGGRPVPTSRSPSGPSAMHSVASPGARTVMPGMARMIARSSTSWWVLPVRPVSRPGVGGPDLDVGVGLGDEHPDRVGRPVGEEHAERRQPRDVAERREAGRDADHVLLGDAHLEEALGVGVGEPVGPGRGPEVAVEDEQVGVLRGDGAQGVGPRVAHRLGHGAALTERRRVLPDPPGPPARARPPPRPPRRRSRPGRATRSGPRGTTRRVP